MPASNSVDLLLLRHGIAEERLGGLDHPDRALTARGRRRTRAVIDALVCRGVSVERLITCLLNTSPSQLDIKKEIL